MPKDTTDSDERIKEEERKTEEFLAIRIRGPRRTEEMLRREALGVGAGDDRTPPLSPSELNELASLVDEIRAEAEHLASNARFVSSWRTYDEARTPRIPPGEQTSDPEYARDALERLRTACASLQGFRSDTDRVARRVINLILWAAVLIETCVDELRSHILDANADQIADQFPRVVPLRESGELRLLFRRAVEEFRGEKLDGERMPGADKVPRWVEATYVLALRMGLEIGELRAWESWITRAGYAEQRRNFFVFLQNGRKTPFEKWNGFPST